MKKIILSLAFLFCASLAQAQTTATAIWNQPNLLVDAQSYVYTLKVDTAAPITLTATCTTVNSAVQCSAPLTGWIGSVSHNLVLTASNGTVTASGAITTAPGPGVPTGTKVIVVIIGN